MTTKNKGIARSAPARPKQDSKLNDLRLYFQKQSEDKLPPGAIYSSQAPPPKGVQTKTTEGGAEYWIPEGPGQIPAGKTADGYTPDWHENHDFNYTNRSSSSPAEHDGPGWSHEISFNEALPKGKFPKKMSDTNREGLHNWETKGAYDLWSKPDDWKKAKVPTVDEPNKKDLEDGLSATIPLSIPGRKTDSYDRDVPRITYSRVFNLNGKRAAVVCEYNYQPGSRNPVKARQAFYRRTGTGGDEGPSGEGDWVPFDGLTTDNGWVNKDRFFRDKKGKHIPEHVQRYGNELNKIVGHALKELPHDTKMYDNPDSHTWSHLDAHEVNKLIGSKYALSNNLDPESKEYKNVWGSHHQDTRDHLASRNHPKSVSNTASETRQIKQLKNIYNEYSKTPKSQHNELRKRTGLSFKEAKKFHEDYRNSDKIKLPEGETISTKRTLSDEAKSKVPSFSWEKGRTPYSKSKGALQRFKERFTSKSLDGKIIDDFDRAVQIAMARKSQQQKDMTKIGGQDILKDAIRKAPKLGPWAAFIAGLGMSDELVRASGEMTPSQQREWERTIRRQMRRKSLDKDLLSSLKTYMKDNNDTYVRRTPVKNGVKLEKKLAVPPFQGAQWDPAIHRWVKGGEVGNSVVNRGGKKRIRATGAGAHQRSVGGHGKGGLRVSRRPIQQRRKQKPAKGVKRSSAVARFVAAVKRKKKRS